MNENLQSMDDDNRDLEDAYSSSDNDSPDQANNSDELAATDGKPGTPIGLYIIGAVVVGIIALLIVRRLGRTADNIVDKTTETISDVTHEISDVAKTALDDATKALDDVPSTNENFKFSQETVSKFITDHYSCVKEISDNVVEYKSWDVAEEAEKMENYGDQIAAKIQAIPGYETFMPVYEVPSLYEFMKSIDNDTWNKLGDYVMGGRAEYYAAHSKFQSDLTALQLANAPSEVTPDDLQAFTACSSYTSFPRVDATQTSTTKHTDFSRKTQILGFAFGNNKRVQTDTMTESSSISVSYDLKCTGENQLSSANMAAIWTTQYLNNVAFQKNMTSWVQANAGMLSVEAAFGFSTVRGPK